MGDQTTGITLLNSDPTTSLTTAESEVIEVLLRRGGHSIWMSELADIVNPLCGCVLQSLEKKGCIAIWSMKI